MNSSSLLEKRLRNKAALQKYRSKQGEEFKKKKESKRVEKLRKRRVSNMSEEERLIYKEKVKIRKRKSREAARVKKQENLNTTSASKIAPFKRAQTYGRAYNKSFRAFSNTPRKRKSIVVGLAKSVGLKLEVKLNESLAGRPGLADKVKKDLQKFFYRPDISYTMPRMKNEITVWEHGKKVKLRKYYLTMFLREAYAIYKSIYSEVYQIVSFTKFCERRPANVLLLKQSPADQCKCKIHENLF